MIFGNCADVALEITVEETIEDWVFGRFMLWLDGHSVGNPDDSADIKGCINWLSDFVFKPRDRCVHELMSVSKYVVWRELVEPVFGLALPNAECDDAIASFQLSNLGQYGDLFSRFHLHHLGMSSFNNLNLILINDGKNSERYLCQQYAEEIMDYTAPIGTLEACAKEAILFFQNNPSYFAPGSAPNRSS